MYINYHIRSVPSYVMLIIWTSWHSIGYCQLTSPNIHYNSELLFIFLKYDNLPKIFYTHFSSETIILVDCNTSENITRTNESIFNLIDLNRNNCLTKSLFNVQVNLIFKNGFKFFNKLPIFIKQIFPKYIHFHPFFRLWRTSLLAFLFILTNQLKITIST